MFFVNKKNILIVIIIVSTLILPLVLGTYLDKTYQSFEHLPLHAMLEAAGAVMALTVALFIFSMHKVYLVYGHYNWTGIALIGMGIFDIFHSFRCP